MTPLPNDPARVAHRKARLYDEAPLHPRSDLRAWRAPVVVAPHPDDESLGCGGLIGLLTAGGTQVRVVFVSDGTMSHPNSQTYDRAARTVLREEEARAACRQLGVSDEDIVFLRLPDGEVPREWHPDFAASASNLAARLRDWRTDTLVVPWRRDPHCDHRASWEICKSAVERLDGPVRWVEYPIWMWEADNIVDLPRPDEMIAWRLDVADQLPRKERAVRAHRSQLGEVIHDDKEGFVLQEKMIAHFLRPHELYLEAAAKRNRSLSGEYFEAVYNYKDDPWNFETSPYEAGKYAATLEALPRARYASGFEIGCSIGVLTEKLANRCDRLLSVDVSEAPLRRARRRLADRKQVEFRKMRLPEEFPESTFDLVVLSEVGYYWGYDDLDRAIGRIRGAVAPGGTLILVHFTPYVPDYPLTGDEVHEAFRTELGNAFYHHHGARAERYRLDVWCRHGG